MINVGSDVLVRFDKDEQGKYTMSFIVNGENPIITHEYQPKDYKKEELNAFSGEYYSKELDVNYTLKLENDALMLYVNGNKVSALQSIMENLFSNDNYGTFKFITSNGKVTAFKLAAGRVKNLMFEKK